MDSYTQFVLSREKDPAEVQRSLTFLKTRLIHAALLLTSEAGELADAIKKHVIYDKPLDEANVIEELGDLEYAAALIRDTLGVTREQVLAANQSKLTKRYPVGYSNAAAAARADKQA